MVNVRERFRLRKQKCFAWNWKKEQLCKSAAASLRSELKSPRMISDLFIDLTLCSNLIGTHKLTYIVS